jgi:hypothetical protein
LTQTLNTGSALPVSFEPGVSLKERRLMVFSVRTDRRAHCTNPGALHCSGDFELAGIPGAIPDPDEGLSGTVTFIHSSDLL